MPLTAILSVRSHVRGRRNTGTGGEDNGVTGHLRGSTAYCATFAIGAVDSCTSPNRGIFVGMDQARTACRQRPPTGDVLGRHLSVAGEWLS